MQVEGQPAGTILWKILRVQQLQLRQSRQQAKMPRLIRHWFHQPLSVATIMFFFDRLCGGHGQCVCGQCLCEPDWGGSDCSCYMKTDKCMAENQQVCNGRGVCQCGMCICTHPGYFGPTCEVCPECPGACQLKAECVECMAFGTGPKKAV